MSKICFVINSFDIGGIERVIVTLCNGLCKHHHVDLITLKNHGALKETLSCNVNIVDFCNIKARNLVKPLLLYLNKNKPDYIVTSIWPITVLSHIAIKKAKSDVKQIVTHHALFDLENKKNIIADFCTKKIIAFFYNRAYKVLAVSVSVKRFLQNIGVKVVSVMYNPFDTEQRKLNVKKELVNAVQYEKYFVFVGRLAKIKNVPLILKAFSRFILDSEYKEYNLLIIGDGPEKDSLIQTAQNLGISEKTFFLGSKTYPEAFIKNAQAVLMASFSEAMPVTVLESFGFNVPVVSTPASGCLDIFNLLGYSWHTNSFDNAEEYCSLMKYVVSHKDEFPDMASRVEENYGLEKILDLWNEVLA